MDQINRTLIVWEIQSMPQELLNWYFTQGYTIVQGYTPPTEPLATNIGIKSMQSGDTILTVAVVGGLIIGGIWLYYKVWLPERYKLEFSAAKRAGVPFSAVSVTE